MYENAFGLREPAFNLTPDPRFFFPNSSQQEAYATLCYGVEQRKGLIVISGEAGTGKSTLLRLFLQNAPARIHASCILDPRLNFVELLRSTLDAFGLMLKNQDRASMICRMREYLTEQSKHGHIVALLLDEAQDLTNEVLEELRLLSNLDHGGENLVQIVLCGRTEFELRLDRTTLFQFKQRVALCSRLRPLPRENITSYINCRLTAAGYTGSNLFAASAVDRIAIYSRGIPRLINTICDNALLIAWTTSQHSVGAETIEEVADELNLEDPGRYPPRTLVSQARAQVPQIFARDTTANGKRRDEMEDLGATKGLIVSVPSDKKEPKKRKFNKATRRSAACVVVVVILTGAMPDSSWQNASIEFSRATGRFNEAFTVFRESIDRVLTAHRPPPTTAKERPGVATTAPTRTAISELQSSPQVYNKKVKTASPSRLNDRIVVAKSLVRDGPTASAEIIATLRPGARVRLLGRTGDYWQIRSREPEITRGFVHKEDAFFRPLE